jgi:hypothetical protein
MTISCRFLQGFYSALKGEQVSVPTTSSVRTVGSGNKPAATSGDPGSGSDPAPPTAVVKSISPATPCLNSTFVKETVDYAMTPLDPLQVAENYDIDDLGSDDSTDEEDCPRKV